MVERCAAALWGTCRYVVQQDEEGDDVDWDMVQLYELHCECASQHKEDAEACKAHVAPDDVAVLQHK